MEKWLFAAGKLYIVFKLETSLCFNPFWSHDSDVLGGQILEFKDNSEEIKIRCSKRLVWCFAFLGLLPLLIFKYYNFINDNISAGLETLGLQFELPGLNWAIPMGISFFTFQAVGYMLDVYHGRIETARMSKK